MNGNMPNSVTQSALNASWARCAKTYNLKRDAARPILRLQSSEVAPRLEALTELTGGRQGIFRQLASVAAGAGHCLVITDADGILVRLESKDAEASWNGIALGSVWDERVAGTNGVSMALSEGQAFTVSGQDHYYAQLTNFACSAVPLRDAHDQIIGVANLSSVGRGNPSETLFAQQVLRVAASRLQTTLFEQTFKDSTVVSFSAPGRKELFKEAERVAVDDAGFITGATSSAHHVSGKTSRDAIIGERFDAVFGADINGLNCAPERVMSVRRDDGPMLDVWVRMPPKNARSVPGWTPKPKAKLRRQNAPSLQDLAAGSSVMRGIFERVQTSFEHGVPILIEGETGTGKTALISALATQAFRAVTIDCASVDDTSQDRAYIQSLLQQARMVDDGGSVRSVLIFDNINEMPVFGQTGLRAVLNDFEMVYGESRGPRIIATSKKALRTFVDTDVFRDDLYFLMAGSRVTLPPLRSREQLDTLAEALARSMAGPKATLSDEAKSAIRAHDWPGNIRELKAVLQQALMYGDGARIGALDLFPQQTPVMVTRSSPALLSEEQLILEALQSTRWNVSKAARLLGMSRATINRKMKALGISRPA
ncbi:MAG: helix-turn-helix domain-containing protein [Pseudomonadota bacterium]